MTQSGHRLSSSCITQQLFTAQCTKVRFASFLSGGFITAIVVFLFVCFESSALVCLLPDESDPFVFFVHSTVVHSTVHKGAFLSVFFPMDLLLP